MATNVQEYIQNLVPTQANNGNPNTAYNNSPVPVMDAFGNWATPAVSPAASATFRRSTTAPWLNVGGGGTGLNLPVFPTLPPLASTPFTPNVPSNGTGGGINPWTPPTQVGGTPTSGTGGGGSRPPVTSGSTGNVGGGRDAMDVLSGGGISGVPIGSFTTGVTDPLAGWSNNISLPAFFQGADTPGGYLLEGLDKLTEGYLPGDLVQQGNFNLRQAAVSLANKLGIPVESAASLLGKGDELGAWLAGGYGDLKGDTRFTSTAMGNTAGWEFGQVNPITGELSLGLLNNIVIPQGYTPTTVNQARAMELAFGPNWASGAPVTGGTGGPRSTVQYGSEAERQASIAATQDALRQSASRSPNNRQTGGDMWGRAYEF